MACDFILLTRNGFLTPCSHVFAHVRPNETSMHEIVGIMGTWMMDTMNGIKCFSSEFNWDNWTDTPWYRNVIECAIYEFGTSAEICQFVDVNSVCIKGSIIKKRKS